MAEICPTVTPNDLHQYREQLERLMPFARRIHLDFMDGKFAPSQSPDLHQIWLPEGVTIDLHIMYKNPADSLAQVIKLNPHLLVVHAEAEGDFVSLAKELKSHGIKTGVAILQQTTVEAIKPALSHIDHVLVFSGHLGYFGGKTDLSLLDKVKELKRLKPELEIGWDGGINDENARALIQGGVDVLNVGGFIQHAIDPESAYAKLVEIAEKQI